MDNHLVEVTGVAQLRGQTRGNVTKARACKNAAEIIWGGHEGSHAEVLIQSCRQSRGSPWVRLQGAHIASSSR